MNLTVTSRVTGSCQLTRKLWCPLGAFLGMGYWVLSSIPAKSPCCLQTSKQGRSWYRPCWNQHTCQPSYGKGYGQIICWQHSDFGNDARQNVAPWTVELHGAGVESIHHSNYAVPPSQTRHTYATTSAHMAMLSFHLVKISSTSFKATPNPSQPPLSSSLNATPLRWVILRMNGTCQYPGEHPSSTWPKPFHRTHPI